MRQHGLSLVELMVAIAIGMVPVLAVTQSMIFFDGQRRGTTTGADSQSNGAFASYLIERDVRVAGYGIFSTETPGITRMCSVDTGGGQGTVLAYNSERSTPDYQFAANSVPFVPIAINPPGLPAGDAGTDVVFINYSGGNSGLASRGVDVASHAAGAFRVPDRAGFLLGDTIIAVPAVAGAACSLYEVSGLDGSTICPGLPALTGGISSLPIGYGTGAYPSSYNSCASVTPKRNKAGGLGVIYASSGGTAPKIYNTGSVAGLTSVAYAVRGGQLTRCSYHDSPCEDAGKVGDTTVWVPVAAGIVMLRAELGLDTDNDRQVDVWRATACAAGGCVPTYADLVQAKLVRLAVVARSQHHGGTGITATQPAWNGQTAINLSLSLSDWQNYRYSTTEVVVPIRNMVWGANL